MVRVCMCVCMYACMYERNGACMDVCMRVCVFMCLLVLQQNLRHGVLYVCMRVVCLYVCVCLLVLQEDVRTCTRMYVYIYVCVSCYTFVCVSCNPTSKWVQTKDLKRSFKQKTAKRKKCKDVSRE